MDHRSYNDPRFLSAFADGSFPPQLFSHEAHLRLAFLLIRKRGPDQAADELCDLIRDFDRLHGDGMKFNVTVTVAACRIVHHFMQKAPQAGFDDLLSEFPQLKTEFLRLIRSHYGFDIFQHPEARIRYLEPDLLPFS